MRRFVVPVLAGLLLMGCAGNLSNDRYETSAAGRVNSVAEGVVMNVRVVQVATSNGSVGQLAGGVAGAAAGSMIGGNTAVNVIGGVGGAVLGGYLGGKAQEGLSKQTGYEYVVKLDTGKMITITQGSDEKFTIGERVYVLDANYGDRARIISK